MVTVRFAARRGGLDVSPGGPSSNSIDIRKTYRSSQEGHDFTFSAMQVRRDLDFLSRVEVGNWTSFASRLEGDTPASEEE